MGCRVRQRVCYHDVELTDHGVRRTEFRENSRGSRRPWMAQPTSRSGWRACTLSMDLRHPKANFLALSRENGLYQEVISTER